MNVMPIRIRRRAAVTCAVTVVLMGAAGCWGSSRPAGDHYSRDAARPAVRVASFDFPESRVLAEIYASALQSRGYPVTRFSGLGSREVVEPALEQNLVDFVPEYAGSALSFLLAADADANADAADSGIGNPAEVPAAVPTAVPKDPPAVLRALSAALAARGLSAMQPAPAQDQNGFVVTAPVAAAKGLRQISDLRLVPASLTLGGPPECPERPFCLLGLQTEYGLRFRGFTPMPSRAVTAAALIAGEIDVGMLETTDPHLGDGRLVLLTDDRGLQPTENIVPVIRPELTAAYGSAFTGVVDSVSANLTTADVVALNRRVVLAGEPVERVAADWLRGHPPT